MMRKKARSSASPIKEKKKMAFTAVFLKSPEGYVGFVEELPGTNTQGATLAETRRNLREAIRLVLDTNRRLSGREIGKKNAIREKIEVPLR
jgi:predicted RNase H-like HicB family nuclease